MIHPFHHHHYHRRVCIGLHICKNYYEIMVNLTVATKMQLMSCLPLFFYHWLVELLSGVVIVVFVPCPVTQVGRESPKVNSQSIQCFPKYI